MAAGNQWKHLEFTLALWKRFFSLLNLKTFEYELLLTHWLLRTRKHMVNLYFRTRNMLPRNNADVTHCENCIVLFSKKSCLPSWRQVSRYTFKTNFYLVKIWPETSGLPWASPNWRRGRGLIDWCIANILLHHSCPKSNLPRRKMWMRPRVYEKLWRGMRR